MPTELYIKTEKLLFFRMAFAAVGLPMCMGVAWFERGEVDLTPIFSVIIGVIVYAALAHLLLKRSLFRHDKSLSILNAVLIGSDVVALTGLVHFTRGIESDLYVLYLLPILLSSYTFKRLGISITALFVSLSYVTLLLIENVAFLPYLIDQSGLAGAYSHQLWRRIFAKSALLVSVAFIWGRFCEYMSGVAQQGANELREQLEENRDLVAEVQAQASREELLNSINSAVRSTLDLNQIFETAVDELGKALQIDSCAIVVPNEYAGEPPVICESMKYSQSAETEKDSQLFSTKFCEFVLQHKSTYEKGEKEGSVVKYFEFTHPALDPLFAPIKDEVSKLGFASLMIKPMMYADQSKGVILLAERAIKRSWTGSEIELVKSIAGQVAVAVEHAELVDQLSRKNKALVQKNLNLDSKNIELRAIQSQLIHQEKMASLGRLVAGIAHELNNPINFVHGNLPYLKEYFEDLKRVIAAVDQIPASERQGIDEMKTKMKYDFLVTDLDNILADLNEGADRIRHIIRNLRSFSRLDEAELKEASIQEGIESTLKILSQYYGRDKIPVQADYASLPPVLCYPGQLNQVWMNLLSNAAQATIDLPDPVVRIKTEIEGDMVITSISDNGPGIKPEVQSKIFEPFFTTKPVGQGTGLGLSICHSIIERHGGHIWCESNLGEGTTFRVEIPVRARVNDLVRATTDAAHDPD